MTITITPVEITAAIQGNFPIELAVNPSIQVTPIIGGVGVKGDKGDAGTPGLQGSAGTNFSTYVAGENLSGHIAVYVNTDGKVYPMVNQLYLPIVGITIGAVSAGAYVDVQHTGAISMNGWGFIPQIPVFVRDNGTLSTTPSPNARYNTIVGIASSPNSMVIGIQSQIKII